MGSAIFFRGGVGMCTPILYKAPKPGKEPDWEKWCLLLLVVIVLILFLSGCHRDVYIPVETVRTEASVRDRFLRDSIYVHDSTYVKDKGDTVWIERWHTCWRDRLFTDTCYIQRTDSVAVPYPVEKKLSGWEGFKMKYGGSAVVGLISVALGLIVCVSYRLKRKG